MARRLTHQNLRLLSDSLQKLYQACELEAFPRHVFAAVTPLVRCDYFSYNEFSADGSLTTVHCEPELPEPATQFLLELGPIFSKEHPTISYVTRTGSPEPFKITDFTSQRQWRQTRLYSEFYRPLACEYQMAFASPLADGQMALAFNSAGRDYSDEDRQLLELLRPHLLQAHANAQLVTKMSTALRGLGGAMVAVSRSGDIEFATGEALRLLQKYFALPNGAAVLPRRISDWLLKPVGSSLAAAPLVIYKGDGRLKVTLASREGGGACNLLLEEKDDSAEIRRLIALGLTPREAEVLLWVARGKTSGEIATILGSKPATVSKHLDHIYQKLGVENRTSAAAYVSPQ
jgi:DNA-binding CsgD family transcriptional regulator